MSRITNQLAEEIAKAMVAKKEESLKNLKGEISKKVSDEILRLVPKGIQELYAKFPKYFRTTSSIQLTGNGCNYEWISLDQDIPVQNTNYFNPEPKFAKDIILLINKKDKFKKELEELKLSIENALKQLRTFKNVRESFPEAAEFLPPDGKPMLPALNLDIIRKNLK